MISFSLYKIIDTFFQALYLALIIRVLLSWIPHDPHHPILQWIYRITDPLLKPFQNIVPAWKVGLDLSPLFAFIAISIIRQLLSHLLL